MGFVGETYFCKLAWHSGYLRTLGSGNLRGARSARELFPIVIGCRYGLKVHGYYVGGGGEAVGGFGINGSEFVEYFGVGLSVFYAAAAQGNGEFKAFLWGVGD